jgi:hypothetical protein
MIRLMTWRPREVAGRELIGTWHAADSLAQVSE